ncbi:zinc-ribbon and DUF3426 domain-containing protein [Methylomonas montana]|uniref:zinc-ribbon and DUF3426 domain-containing protein n=1 Tax=Methylomonas montana TaxID=3058963 RepID=UPI00265AB61B|nr:zinc-ribbon and DUF3426 domain-containing protein [Methylomonas montana]WKJ89335.1 zinc-ribbon and DUF3426 domain-containing protein [Methylomonas montana]
MYSRCPHCAKQHELTIEQLRSRRGLLICSACGEQFDSLRFLSEHEYSELAEDLPGQHQSAGTRQQIPAAWLAASVTMSLLLVAQIIYFEGLRLIMQPQLKAGLDAVCAAIPCRLPIYRNLDELAVFHSDLQIQADHSYLFTAAISNQALFTQAAPDLKLTLLSFNGQPLAERVFSAQQYLVGPSKLAADQIAEIRLAIVAPATIVGGYTFTLL